MKIDCPHCGVSGAVDDSLAGKKLRCPRCSKIFLVPDEFLAAPVDSGMMRQEILYGGEPESPVVEQQPDQAEDIGDEQDSDDLEGFVGLQDTAEEPVAEEEDTPGEEFAADDDSGLLPCSACGQSFVPEVLVDVDSKLYCALCKPEPEEKVAFEIDVEEPSLGEDEELEGFAFHDDDFDEDEGEGEGEDESELETCSQCGEPLHPEFLQTVGSKRYCAFCAPEDEEGGAVAEPTDYVEDVETVDEADLIQEEDTQEEDLDSIDTIEVEEVEEIAYLEEVEEDLDVVDTLEREEDDSDDEGYLKDVCSVCGESFHLDFLQEVDSKLYCGLCQPEVIEVSSPDAADGSALFDSDSDSDSDFDSESEFRALVDTDEDEGEIEYEQSGTADFTIGEVLKEAWQKTKGAKGSIWGGLIFMYLILFGIGFGAAYGLQGGALVADPTTAMGINAGVQLLTTLLSAIFSAGLMLIGVRRAMEQRVSWKMVFSGFSRAFSITVALVLQVILILIGFLLLIIPGIYLSVGYALTLPLILEKGLGPWQALEASRKAIHKKWWSVLGLYLLMGLIYLVSIIPLGIGLIWTVPMFFMVMGVLYKTLFVSSPDEEEFVEEDEESWEEDETAEEE